MLIQLKKNKTDTIMHITDRMIQLFGIQDMMNHDSSICHTI